MPATFERARDLSALFDGVVDVFPPDARYSRYDDSERNFIVKWPLKGQPADKSPTSKEVSIRFSEEALHTYSGMSQEDKAAAHQILRALIQQRMAGYDEGRDVSRYGAKEPFIVDTTGEFLD
ncbi:hypothetical protein [Paraburkholderia sp. DGU8]|uniref:hypothetical protein n=1 Tax=Paraburkholderia sp. DGU8 TaxID=3161997 RepID=UPI0034666D47